MPCYALEEGQHARNNPRWIPAEIKKYMALVVYEYDSYQMERSVEDMTSYHHVTFLIQKTCTTDCEQANKPQVNTLQNGNHQNLLSTSSRSLSEKQGPSR